MNYGQDLQRVQSASFVLVSAVLFIKNYLACSVWAN